MTKEADDDDDDAKSTITYLLDHTHCGCGKW